MGLRAEPPHYTLDVPMSSLLGRAFLALRPASARVPGPLHGVERAPLAVAGTTLGLLVA